MTQDLLVGEARAEGLTLAQIRRGILEACAAPEIASTAAMMRSRRSPAATLEAAALHAEQVGCGHRAARR